MHRLSLKTIQSPLNDYSRVPNKRRGTLINFLTNFQPLCPYSIPYIYWFHQKVHPISLFYILLNWNIQIFAIFQPLASKKCWFFIILKEVLTHFIKFYTLKGNIPSPTINIFGKFPPSTFIPHPTFILLRVNVHPIWLFHTLPLLGTQEYLILIPINLVPNFTHRGNLVIRGRCCSFDWPSAPLGYKQTVSRGRW